MNLLGVLVGFAPGQMKLAARDAFIDGKLKLWL